LLSVAAMRVNDDVRMEARQLSAMPSAELMLVPGRSLYVE